MEKEINIVAPEGFEIDKENSTFDCIRFKPIENVKKRWKDNANAEIKGFFIRTGDSSISYCDNQFNTFNNYNVFATEKQAKSALAIARISQIMATIKGFVARDKDGQLCIFHGEKPHRGGCNRWWQPEHCPCGDWMNLPEDMFSEIKWEDEPMKVELIIRKE